MFRAVDHFLMKILVPPIIWLCQKIGWSQYRFAHHIILVGWFLGGYHTFIFHDYAATIFFIIWSVFAADKCIRNPERIEYSVFAGRVLLMCIFIFSAGIDFYNRKTDPISYIFFLCLFLREYALTIETIPPTKIKQKIKRKSLA